MKTSICELCLEARDTRAAVVAGKYYPSICSSCLNGSNDSYSTGAQSFDRRRQYEDHAQDTIQPYDAKGPNLEFFRQYPEQSKKIYNKATIEQLKRKI